MKAVRLSGLLRPYNNNLIFSISMLENWIDTHTPVNSFSKTVSGGNVFKLERLVVVVNLGNGPWALCVASIQERRIQYYCSLGGEGAKYCAGIKKYFQLEVRLETLVTAHLFGTHAD